jgi:nicotinate-nucleotide pyrophosphorylase (carboxylating)
MNKAYKGFDFKTAEKLIRQALKEDIGTGDVTSDILIPRKAVSKADICLKEHGLTAGHEIFNMVYNIVDPRVKVTFTETEGRLLRKGTVFGCISGPSRSLLRGERVALNFIQRMSGIATAVFCLSNRLKNEKIKITDTRKTTPNLRVFEKLAVKIGGGSNHRFGLYDMMLIKDNHIEANGGIKGTIAQLKKNKIPEELKIEIEVKSISDLKCVLEEKLADIVMLDNFELTDVKKAVNLINGSMKVEISGGVNQHNIAQYRKIKGIDFISVGALTHSVRSLDISLDFVSG